LTWLPGYAAGYLVPPVDTQLLFIEEVAALARVSAETVRFWVRRGKLPSVRPGRRRMVRRDELDAFLARDVHAERKRVER
jgi:excisionase family DNA binding protein